MKTEFSGHSVEMSTNKMFSRQLNLNGPVKLGQNLSVAKIDNREPFYAEAN